MPAPHTHLAEGPSTWLATTNLRSFLLINRRRMTYAYRYGPYSWPLQHIIVLSSSASHPVNRRTWTARSGDHLLSLYGTDSDSLALSEVLAVSDALGFTKGFLTFRLSILILTSCFSSCRRLFIHIQVDKSILRKWVPCQTNRMCCLWVVAALEPWEHTRWRLVVVRV